MDNPGGPKGKPRSAGSAVTPRRAINGSLARITAGNERWPQDAGASKERKQGKAAEAGTSTANPNAFLGQGGTRPGRGPADRGWKRLPPASAVRALVNDFIEE